MITITTPMVQNLSSLHVWGMNDTLVTPEQSQTMMSWFLHNPQSFVHEGSHYVPMKAAHVQVYLDFIQAQLLQQQQKQQKEEEQDDHHHKTEQSLSSSSSLSKSNTIKQQQQKEEETIVQTTRIITTPNEENAQAQQDELEALRAIFPDEVQVLSTVTENTNDGTFTYEYPIQYQIQLLPTEPYNLWPPHPVSLHIEYPYNYPNDDDNNNNTGGIILKITFVTGNNNGMQITCAQAQAS